MSFWSSHATMLLIVCCTMQFATPPLPLRTTLSAQLSVLGRDEKSISFPTAKYRTLLHRYTAMVTGHFILLEQQKYPPKIVLSCKIAAKNHRSRTLFLVIFISSKKIITMKPFSRSLSHAIFSPLFVAKIALASHFYRIILSGSYVAYSTAQIPPRF